VCVLFGSPVWPSPPVVGPLWGPPLWVGPLWVGSPSCRVRVPCDIYSRDVSRSCTRSRIGWTRLIFALSSPPSQTPARVNPGMASHRRRRASSPVPSSVPGVKASRGLAFTRYSFTLRLFGTNQSSVYCLPSTGIAHNSAMKLHVYRATYDPPRRPLCVCHTQYNVDNAIV